MNFHWIQEMKYTLYIVYHLSETDFEHLLRRLRRILRIHRISRFLLSFFGWPENSSPRDANIKRVESRRGNGIMEKRWQGGREYRSLRIDPHNRWRTVRLYIIVQMIEWACTHHVLFAFPVTTSRWYWCRVANSYL